ncbi:MAG: SMP-30/gluconolactonase/LRE family protein [Acidimicrobiales bacterium]
MGDTPELREVAAGLRFPEGPIAMDDGSVVLVEIARGTLSRVWPDGKVEVVADLGGGPNGAAIGPDGKVYVCNNGGCFRWEDRFGYTVPGSPPPDEWSGGSIQRVDLETGEVELVYTESSSGPLRAPNDLVFDGAGGFWFTDHGVRLARSSDRTGVHYARPDGSSCQEILFPLDAPNGIGLSPDESVLYVAETHTSRVWAWDLAGPGELGPIDPLRPEPGGRLLVGLSGLQLLDSLAVDSEGWVCVGTLVNGGITAVCPQGRMVEHTSLPDPLVTNVCFAGDDPVTAYATLSATGRLVAFDWRPHNRY